MSSLPDAALRPSAGPRKDNPLLRSALGGARMEKASGSFSKEAPRLLVALRRAVPFLSRRRVPLRIASVRPCSLSDLVAGLPRPAFVQPLSVRGAGTGGRGAIVLDANASALFLDGVLGGDGTGLPELPPAGLTAPQSALVAGITSNIVRTFAEALEAAFAVKVTPARDDSSDDLAAERASIACVLEIGEPTGPAGETPCAQVIVSLPKEVLGTPADADPRRLEVRRPRGAGPGNRGARCGRRAGSSSTQGRRFHAPCRRRHPEARRAGERRRDGPRGIAGDLPRPADDQRGSDRTRHP